ncbi:MAG: hypothetical protein JXQ71_17890 [Verrucomicrobia bacterium]|nr:hypothetical protein [Verrucomicrobiota bacterium]
MKSLNDHLSKSLHDQLEGFRPEFLFVDCGDCDTEWLQALDAIAERFVQRNHLTLAQARSAVLSAVVRREAERS